MYLSGERIENKQVLVNKSMPIVSPTGLQPGSYISIPLPATIFLGYLGNIFSNGSFVRPLRWSRNCPVKRIRLSRIEEKLARPSIGFSKCCIELFLTLCSPLFIHRNSRPTSSTRVQGCPCVVSTCAYLVSEAFIFTHYCNVLLPLDTKDQGIFMLSEFWWPQMPTRWADFFRNCNAKLNASNNN